MSIVFNEAGLKDVEIPCLLQTFVNHNARLFKIFVIGDQHHIVLRPSIKNLYAGGMLEYVISLVYSVNWKTVVAQNVEDFFDTQFCYHYRRD